jgi:hypothetical protein
MLGLCSFGRHDGVIGESCGLEIVLYEDETFAGNPSTFYPIELPALSHSSIHLLFQQQDLVSATKLLHAQSQEIFESGEEETNESLESKIYNLVKPCAVWLVSFQQ